MAGKPTYKELEDALCDCTEIFTQLFELISYSVAISRMEDGRYLLVNDGFCKNTGFSKHEVIGRTQADLDLYFDPADRDALVQELKRHGRVEEFESRFKGKDGTLYYNKVTARAICYKGEACILSITTFESPQKKVQKALHESRERSRNIVESIAEGYFEVDLAGDLTFFNEAVVKATGYSREELMGMNYRVYTSPEAARKIYKIFNEVFRSSGPGKILDYTILRKDGTCVMVEASTSLLRNASGEPIGFYGILRDRTEQKKAEEALQQSEESYRNVLELAPDVITVGRIEDGRYLQVNDAFCRLTGYAAEEAIGRTALELNLYVHPEERQRLLQSMQRKGRIEGEEVQFRTKSGTVLDTLVSARQMNFRGQECLLMIVTNITNLKKAQEALRQSEENYRNILANMEEGYYEVDLAGRFTFFNKALCRMHGLSPEELMGISNREYMSAETAKIVYAAFNNVYRTGIPTQILDYEIMRKDGSIGIQESSVVLLKDEAGRPTGFRGISRDRTKQKRAEQALQESEQNLRITLDSIGDAVIATDVNGKIVRMNPVAETLTGWALPEAVGRNLAEIFHIIDEKSRKKVVSPVEKVLRERKIVGLGNHTLLISKNGIERPVSDSAAPIMTQLGELAGVVLVFRDVTEKRKAEKALRESEEKYRSILEEMEEGYYEIDLAGNFTYFNESTRRLHGYPEVELLGMNYRQYVGPEKAKYISRLFRKIYRTGVPARILDYEIIRKDGSICMIEMSAYPLRDPSGQMVGFWGISRDRTERRRAEMALQESEARMRSIFENAAVGIAYYNTQGQFIRVNKGYCDLVGYSAAELSGMHASDLTHPDDRRMESNESEKLLKGKKKSYSMEKRLVSKNGGTLWARTTVSRAFADHDKPMYFIAVLENITERKKAAEALRHSEERYRLLVDNANEGIYITQEGLIKFLNPKIEQICGYTAGEMIDLPFINLVHPEDKEVIYEQQQRKLEDQKMPGIFSFRILNRDQEVLWAELSTVGITWEGKPASLNFLRDITPHKKIEAQLLQAKKMEAVGTLAGGIAHDFNNLLMGIQGNAALTLMDMTPEHPHHEKLSNIEKYVKAGADLTKQLLGAARGGKYEVHPTDLNKVLAISSELFGRTKKEISIYKKLLDGLWPVEVDRGQIEQVLLNLYVNAWHAMPEGGDLYLETQNILLDEYYVQPYGVPAGRYCKVSITDTGIGIDQKDQKRIFDPFFTTKSIGRGTGLGLASAYGIISNHGGIITVYSEKGAGTTFNIYLPATMKEVVEHNETPTEIVSGKETVLFVDDEKGIVDVGRMILERLGYRVITAQGGREAIEIYRLRKNEIDLVILDMIMPGMSGSDTFNELKEICPDVKVILSSGYSINGQAKGILERGCRGFIQKPFSMKELSVKLRQIFDLPEC